MYLHAFYFWAKKSRQKEIFRLPACKIETFPLILPLMKQKYETKILNSSQSANEIADNLEENLRAPSDFPQNQEILASEALQAKLDSDPLFKHRLFKFIDRSLQAHVSSLHPHYNEKRISKDIISFFFDKGAIAALLLYAKILHEHSGKLNHEKIRLLSVQMRRSGSYIRRLLAQLERLGMAERRKNGWWFATGLKKFNISHGICHSIMVAVPKNALNGIKELRNFCYSKDFRMADRKSAKSQSAKGYGTVNGNGVSVSYIAGFTGKSERTVQRHKKLAQQNGFVKFKKHCVSISEGPPTLAPTWFGHHPAPERCFLKWVGPGTVAFCERTTDTLEMAPFFKKKKLRYAPDEREAIKSNFKERSLIPLNRIIKTQMGQERS